MPWTPLPRLAFAICTYPFLPSSPADLPLQIGDELYIIEEGGRDASWFRGYLVAPPSLLSGLTSSRGQTLEKRVFTGIFPRACVEIRELLGDATAHALPGRHPSTRRSPLESDLSQLPTTRPTGPDGRSEAAAEPQSVSGQEEARARSSATPSSLATSTTSIQKPPAPVPMLKIGDESAPGKDEPLVDEIASCLREWHSTKLHHLLLAREYDALDDMSALVARLDYARKQLFHEVLTDHELQQLRESTIWDLVKGNKTLGQDVIVRSTEHKGRILTYDDSAVEINRQQALMSLLDNRPASAHESKASFHLYINLKSFSSDIDRQTSIALCLYSKRQNEPVKLLSELYQTDATSSFPGATVGFDGLRKTLFTDISPSEAGEGSSERSAIFLVAKVITSEPPVLTQSLQSLAEKVEQNEALMSQIGATFRNAGQVGLKGGRQSIMWMRQRAGRKDGELDPGAQQRLDTGKFDRPTTSDTKASQQPPQTTQSQSQSMEEVKKLKPVKKLTGVGVCDVTRHVRGLQEGDVSIAIESVTSDPSSNLAESNDDRERVIAAVVGGDAVHPRSTTANLSVFVKAFRADNGDDLIQETPTLLHSISASHRLGFASAPRKSRSDIYITLRRPIIHDNSYLSHPRSGTVPAFGEDNLSNLQLTLEVRDADGKRIEKCIFPYAGGSGIVAWRSHAVERGEWWNQTIRLGIRPEKVPGSHVVMSLAQAHSFPFALCWMPLWVQGAFVQDGVHNLALYKYDEHTTAPHSGKGAYVTLPWNVRNRESAITGPLARLEISTFLCSTAYSQDPNLLDLLHWKEKRHDEMAKILQKFPFVPEIEIVKLLKDVLNALFGALVEYSGRDEFEDLLFNALIVVFAIVHDRRFNLQPVLDEYADKDFSYPFAFPCLVRSFASLLQDPTGQEKSRKLRSTCKVGAHVIKFIVKARMQQMQKETNIGISAHGATFARDLWPIFSALGKLMQDPNPVLVGTKTLMVQNFHSWLPELASVAIPQEVLAIALQFVDSCSDVSGRLVLYKLLLIKHITDEDVFKSKEIQGRWQSRVIEWLAPHWGSTSAPSPLWREQIRLCCSVVSSIFNKYGADTSAYTLKLIQSYKTVAKIPRPAGGSFSPLFPSAYPFPTKPTSVKDQFDEALIEIAALLSATTSAAPTSYAHLPAGELADLLNELLGVLRSVLNFKAFPSDWLSVHIFNHRSIYNALESMFALLLDRFVPAPDDAPMFRDDLWRSYLETLLKLVSSDALALETFPEQKRRAVWKIGGDIRELGADLLGRSWQTLGWEASPAEQSAYGLDRMGGYQVSYVPGLVGSILELCLSVHEGLRNVATGVLQSMIVSEWTLNQNLAAIETAMIDSLDLLYTNKPMNDGMLQRLFIDELRARFKAVDGQKDKLLQTAVSKLLDTVGELFDLLVAVHAPEASSDTLHIMDTLRLLEYLRGMAKLDIFISYVYKLAKIQQGQRNLTEAALAMKLHSDLYQWDSTVTLQAINDPPFPVQSAFDRKEQIYFEMIQYFEDAEDWHQILKIYMELANQYQNYVFDFTKLARCQRAMASIYEKISNGERHQPRFFRVVYRGLGFPSNLRDKQFIFQGLATDRITSFSDKIQQQYPAAQIVSAGAIIDEIEGQFLSIFPISPQKDFEHPVNRRVRTAQPVKEYLMLASPRQFANTTRRQATSANVEDQSQEKVLYTTAESFPTMTRRSEIISMETIRMTPVQIGLERTMRKTQDLQTRMHAVVDGDEAATATLIDDLRTLTAAQGAGTVAGYWRLVAGNTLASTAARTDSVDAADPLESALKVALLDHLLMIRRALDAYPRSASLTTKAEIVKGLRALFSLFCPIAQKTEHADISHCRPRYNFRTDHRLLQHAPCIQAACTSPRHQELAGRDARTHRAGRWNRW